MLFSHFSFPHVHICQKKRKEKPANECQPNLKKCSEKLVKGYEDRTIRNRKKGKK